MPANFSRSLAGVFLIAAMVFCRTSAAAEIRWSTDIKDSLQRAAENDQWVLLEFTADWCVFCKKMEKNTFTDAEVAQRISRDFVAVRVDADQNKGLVKDLGIKGLPAILIVSPELKVIERISGFQTPEALIPKLDTVTTARLGQSKSPALASSQNSSHRPMRRASKQQSLEPEMVAPSRPSRGELEIEAITQEEAPRVGVRRSATPSRGPSFDGPDSDTRQPAPAMSRAASPDSESFFKTISREQESRNETAAQSGPSFEGLCIVSAVDERELVNGNARHQINYKGHTLYFSSAESKDRFQASPATYWPMLDGACAMTLLQDERRVDGSLEFAAVFRKRIWIFASQAAMQEFLQDPADVAEEATELAAELQR